MTTVSSNLQLIAKSNLSNSFIINLNMREEVSSIFRHKILIE